MKDYYQKQVNVAEALIKLAKDGFAKSMPAYGERLKNADYEEALQILSEINLLVQSIKEMEGNLAFSQRQLQGEIDKENEGQQS